MNDKEAVEAVAQALAEVDGHNWTNPGCENNKDDEALREHYRIAARIAVNVAALDTWRERAEKAEAKVDRLHEAVHRSIVIFKCNFDRQNEMPPDLPALLSFALAAIQNLSAVPVILRDTLKAMEAADE